MKFLPQFLNLFRRRKLDTAMAEEMRLHVELQTERNIAAGMNPDEARYAALRQFGNLASIQEQAREGRGWVWLELLWRDFRFAVISLRRSPGFSIAAVITLGIGGAAVALIAVLFDTMLLAGAGWLKQPERVVYVVAHPVNQPANEVPLTWPEFTACREQAQSFSHLSVFSSAGGSVSAGGRHDWEFGSHVDRELFDVLGASAMRGRVLMADDFKPDAPRVAVISHKFWLDRFGGAEDVLGQVVELTSVPAVVVGVMPPGFSFPDHSHYWLPLDLWSPRFADPKNRFLTAIGRLRDEVKIEQASAEMATLAANGQPLETAATKARVVGFTEYGGRNHKKQLRQFLISVLVVQLLACANVAGLMLARGSRRLPQTALRAAFGASRGRLMRELLLEGMLLAVAGLAVGWLLAYWLRPVMLGAISPYWPLPAWWTFDFNGRVLGFTGGVGVITMLAMSLVPAWQCTDTRLGERLRSSGPSRTDHPAGKRLRSAAVVLQLAAATVLLVISGLTLKSAREFEKIDLGVDPHGVAMFGFAPLGNRTPEQIERYFPTLEQRLKEIPGVEAAGFAYPLPGQYGRSYFTLAVEAREAEATPLRVISSFITPDIMNVVRLRLLRGRNFTAKDDTKSEPVVMIDRLVSEKLFPEEDPIGKRIALERNGVKESPWLTVVGVVDATRVHALTEPSPVIYRPVAGQKRMVGTYAFIRSRNPVPSTVQQALAALREVDTNFSPMVVFQGSYERWIANVYWPHKFNSRVMTTFALLAFFIAAVGVHGLVAYVVSQQLRETGIRLALGATPGRVVGELVAHGVKLAFIGLGCGLIATLVFAPALASLAPKADPRDAMVYLYATGMVALVALMATWLPARRAAMVDPVVALRAE